LGRGAARKTKKDTLLVPQWERGVTKRRVPGSNQQFTVKSTHTETGKKGTLKRKRVKHVRREGYKKFDTTLWQEGGWRNKIQVYGESNIGGFERGRSKKKGAIGKTG